MGKCDCVDGSVSTYEAYILFSEQVGSVVPISVSRGIYEKGDCCHLRAYF